VQAPAPAQHARQLQVKRAWWACGTLGSSAGRLVAAGSLPTHRPHTTS
jgi:hypothetical protein